jgi:hypothetical protein
MKTLRQLGKDLAGFDQLEALQKTFKTLGVFPGCGVCNAFVEEALALHEVMQIDAPNAPLVS